MVLAEVNQILPQFSEVMEIVSDDIIGDVTDKSCDAVHMYYLLPYQVM